MKPIKFLLLGATTFLALNANAQPITATSPQRNVQTQTAAKLAAQETQLQQIENNLTAAESELQKRDFCGNQGLVYINGHAAADASGCVDPANF
ncbi:MAG: hypothetical protein COA78_34830 [Blastopirellula sp.]|nr:MAG: hypothetical protein COA78_34830 [Blastopirellula sp.]